MGVLISVTVLLAIGPLLGIAALVADAHAGGPAITARRVVSAAAVGGLLLASPAGCVIAAVPHGYLAALPLFLVSGGLYGLLLGVIGVGVRYLRLRRRSAKSAGQLT